MEIFQPAPPIANQYDLCYIAISRRIAYHQSLSAAIVVILIRTCLLEAAQEISIVIQTPHLIYYLYSVLSYYVQPQIPIHFFET